MESIPEELELAAALVGVDSPSGQESAVARVLVDAFESLGFDEAFLDPAGNAIGVIRSGDGPTVMLNGHIDVVDVGDPDRWPYPPFGATIAQGKLWGRGACDMKGPLASMTVAARDAARAGFRGTLLVTGVVQEEVGGLGARFLSTRHAPDVVILGEPSDLGLKLGHRGRTEVEVTLPGRIAHAAKASLGENALYRAARYLRALESCPLPAGGPLGASTATPTGIVTRPGSPNVVPGSATVTVDYRAIAGDETDAIVARLRGLDTDAEAVVGEEDAHSENGVVSLRFPRVSPPYLVPDGDPAVAIARRAIAAALERCGREYREGVWWFSTDAPYLATTGAPVIGFGPGDPELAHTTDESVPVEHLAVARQVYTDLILAYSEGAA